MSFTIGASALVGMLALMAIGVPIGVSMLTVSIIGLATVVGTEAALLTVSRIPYEFGTTWELSALPMFFLMGAIASHTKMTASLFSAAKVWVGNFPGGLAVATNFACAGFAAASGSSLATTVTIGKIAVPEMTKSKYDPSLSAAVCACSGTLGSLIPPSIIMIIYGIFAEQSVAKLFIAGWIPGILTAFAYVAVIVLRAKMNPELAPTVQIESTWSERMRSLLDIAPVAALILIIILSLYMGFATPTESAAMGVVFAIAIAVLRGTFSFRAIARSVVEACISSANIFFIAAGALMLTKLMAITGLPTFVSAFIGSMGTNEVMLLIGAALVCVILGCFLDPLGLMLITLPIFIPVFENAHVDMIWFGILMVKFVEIGLITPPVGFNVYAIKSVVGDSVPIGSIFRGVFWFFVAEVIVIALLIAFPAITLFLPNTMN